jgi:hypothetical protein
MLRQSSKSVLVARPVMQRGRVEIRSIGPSQCVCFGIDRDASKEEKIAERTIQFAYEDGAEIDRLLGRVIEADAESVRRDRLKGNNSVNRMSHTVSLQWLNGEGLDPLL